MKNRQIVALCLLATPLLFAQCHSIKRLDIHEAAEYRITPLEFPFIKAGGVEDVVDSVKIINFEFSEAALMHTIEKVLSLDNGDFIVTDKQKVCHFSADGKHIRNYSMVGRGPQEYITIGDICVDNNNNSLIILDGMNKILFYSTETGTFIKAVTPDWDGRVKRLDAIIPGKNGGFFILSANTAFRKPGDEFYCLTEFDPKGKKASEGLPTNDFVYMNSMVSQSYNGRYLIKPIDTNNVAYEVRNGEIKPLCWVDFGNRNVEAGAAFMPDGQMYFPQLIETNSYKLPQYFQETESHISFIVAGPKGEAYGYIYAKNDGIGFCIAAPNRMTLPIKFNGSDGEYLYTVMNKYSMEGVEEYADPVTHYLIEKYGVLGETDNQRIIGIKFR